jgi:hypothetical protein
MPRLSPVLRPGIKKISSAAQMAIGENVILRYKNRLLWHHLQKKDTQKAQRSFIVSCARVVTEKDIMEARHANNNVCVLAIEWPKGLNQNSPADATTAPPPAINMSSKILADAMTSDMQEDTLLEVDNDCFDSLVQELPYLL